MTPDETRRVRRQWVRRLTDPDEPLTLEELGHVPAALLLAETTPGELADRLESAASNGRPLAVLDIVLLTLLHLRENAKDARLGTQHLEGMFGTLDEMLAESNPLYQALAAKRAKPVPALPTNGEQP